MRITDGRSTSTSARRATSEVILARPSGRHLTTRRPVEALLIDILDPNRQLKPLFQNYVLHTSDGRGYNGMITEETSNAVRLQ